ncbi:MAG: phospholipase D-like domain-containing protein [Candidatus Ranarchaeia archaeon]
MQVIMRKTLPTAAIIVVVLSLMIIPMPVATQPSYKLGATQYQAVQGGYSNLSPETFKGVFNVTTIIGPDNAWAALKPLLDGVKHTIYVEIYGINDRDILDALWAIKARNNSVDMKILLGRSSLGYASPNDYVAYNLTQGGIPVRWTNEQWTYTHAKFVMIDNETVIVQSGNWAKTSFPNRDADEIGNREWHIAIHNQAVTGYYLNVFDMDWGQGTAYNSSTDGTGTPITNTTSTSGAAVHPFTTIGHYNEYMEITPVFANDTSLQLILELINSANSTLDIQIPYYTNFEEGGAVDEIINATIQAAERGVSVRVITEEGNKDNDQVAALFGEYGIPVVWFKETWFAALHNKGIIVDGVVVYIASINFSDTSIEDNREAGVIIRNTNVAAYYQAVFDYDWNRGEPANPTIQLTQSPISVTSSDEVRVNATFYKIQGINESILSYRVNNGDWTNTSMINITSGELQVWTGTIPGQADGSLVEYKVYALDELGDWYVSPVRSYTVGTGGTSTGQEPDLLLIIIGAVVVVVTVIASFFLKKKGTSSKRKRKR